LQDTRSIRDIQDICFSLVFELENRTEHFIANLSYRQDPLLQEVYDLVVALAIKRGFRFHVPRAGVSRWLFDFWFRKSVAVYCPGFKPRGAIIFNQKHFRLYGGNREFLAIVLAHELGHAIDMNHSWSRNIKHPFITQMFKNEVEDKEVFAWAFAAYLYGVKKILPLTKKRIDLSEEEFLKICSW
jgi:hypothetical protein